MRRKIEIAELVVSYIYILSILVLITHLWNRTKILGWVGFVYSVKCHFQQYFSYIVAVSFIGGGNLSTWRKPLTCLKPLTTLSHNVYWVHLIMSGIRTHNFSDDRHWLHR
jgi:hypothetical protein